MIRRTHGVDPSKVDVSLYDRKVWDFYDKYRGSIRKILSKYTYDQLGRFSQKNELANVRKKLIDAGVEDDRFLLNDKHLNGYYWVIHHAGHEDERFLLRKYVVFDGNSSFRSVEKEYMPRIFWDPKYQDALHRMNQRVREKANLVLNLIPKIKGVVKQYDRAMAGDWAMKAEDQGVIDLLGEKGSEVSAQGEDFEGVVMRQMLAFLHMLHGEIARTVPQDPNVLLIGGSDMDVAGILKQYPQAKIKIVNLDREYLTGIRNRYKEISRTGQLQLFLADAQHLSSYKDADGSRYFPDESFDIVAAPGVDATALPGEQGRAILSLVAEQEVLLARKGGLIMHCYNVNDWQDSMTFQAKAVKDGMLEFVGEKETMAGSLFRRTNKVMNVEKTGGIDLTPAHMNLQTKVDSRLRGNDNIAGGNDKGIVFHLDPAMLAQLQNAPGFVPVIISIQPMNDLRKFLGVASS